METDGQNEEKLSFMTQTTLSVDDTSDVIDALRKRFPKIVGPRKDDICYATTNRQEAVRAPAEQAEVVLVVGSKNSSNSNRLAELAQRMGKRAFLIDDAKDIREEWVKEVKCVGVTAGASAPDILVQNVVARLQQLAVVKPFRWKAVKKTLFSKCRKSCVSIFVKSIKSLAACYAKMPVLLPAFLWRKHAFTYLPRY